MRRTVLGWWCLLLFLRGAQAAAPPLVEQWIAVCPPTYETTLEPLVAHRRAQGLKVVVVPPAEPHRLQAQLQRLCRNHPGRSSILLVGSLQQVPPLRGTISRMLYQPSDAGYGCLQGTRLPQVAVGRFPARDSLELRAMVQKTLALERAGPGPWRRRLTVLAGIPEFNPVVDRLVESMAFARFDKLHPSWTGRAIYSCSGSRFCLPSSQIRSQALAYLREGQAIILYLGHSNAQGLYAGPTTPFLDRDDWARLQGCGVFVTFGCNGCQLAGPDGEGYGLAAMRNPDGPAAVLGSHGICFAAMAQLAAEGVFQQTLVGRPPRRFGECWLAALDGIANGRIDFLSYRLLDNVDGDPRIPQATQRQEHLEMFVLLGDPALQLPQVENDLGLTVDREIRPGATLTVRGMLPPRLHGASVRVTLDRPPSSTPLGLEPLPSRFGPQRDQILRANHRKANQFTIAEVTVLPPRDHFQIDLQVPKELPWARMILRIHAQKGEEESLEAASLTVRREEKSP